MFALLDFKLTNRGIGSPVLPTPEDWACAIDESDAVKMKPKAMALNNDFEISFDKFT